MVHHVDWLLVVAKRDFLAFGSQNVVISHRFKHDLLDIAYPTSAARTFPDRHQKNLIHTIFVVGAWLGRDRDDVRKSVPKNELVVWHGVWR